MLLFSITKRMNKALAPKLLSWSLQLHELSAGAGSPSSSSSSSSSLRLRHQIFVSSLSNRLLLPLAQRLVSIEVHDDYLQIQKIRRVNHLSSTTITSSTSSPSPSSSWWDNFVDKTWSLFFQDYYERQTAKTKGALPSSSELEELAELQAQQLYNAKQKKRLEQRQQRQRQRQRIHGSSTTKKGQQEYDNETIGNNIHFDDHHNELIELGNRRLQLLDRYYIRPAILSSLEDMHRPLFMMMRHQYQHQQHPSSTYYDNFVKWLRGEYLIAKYGLIVQKAVMEHPELRGHEYGLNTTHNNVSIRRQLPSVNTVIQAFGMHKWNRNKAPIPWNEEIGGDINSTDSSSISIEYIIHNKLGGQIKHAGPLNAYFEMKKLWGSTRRGIGGSGRGDTCYELWTREYIFGLAQYLLDRIAEMDRERHVPMETIVLDVGAGDGRLSYFLRRAMEEIRLGTNDSMTAPTETKHRILEQDGTLQSSSSSNPDPELNAAKQLTTLPTILATDDGSWNSSLIGRFNLTLFSSSHHSNFHVEQLSAIESIEKYGPTGENYTNRRLIVVCSWMPPGKDWTADFRRPIEKDDDNAIICEDGNRNDAVGDTTATVRRLVDEYILIGEADNGTCGHNWYTWGNLDFNTSNASSHGSMDAIAPYLRDGYHRVDLSELSVLQFSRFDCQRSSESKTVSFRRF